MITELFRRPWFAAATVVLVGTVPLAALAATSTVGAPWWHSRAAVIGDWLLLPLLAGVLVDLNNGLPTSTAQRRRWIACALAGGLSGLILQIAWWLDPTPTTSWALPTAHRLTAGGYWHAAFVIVLSAAFSGLACRWAICSHVVRMDRHAPMCYESMTAAALSFPLATFLGIVALDSTEHSGAVENATLSAAVLAGIAAVAVLAMGTGWASTVAGLTIGCLLAAGVVTTIVSWPSPTRGAAATVQVAGATAAWRWLDRRRERTIMARTQRQDLTAARKLAPGEGRRIRVAAVDDHPTTLAGLCAALEADARFEVVATVGSHHELMHADVEFDVVVLDLYLHGDPRDGKAADFEAVDVLSQQYPTLIFTSAARDEDAFDVMHHYPGVAGYLVKDVTPDKLREAVAIVANGGQAFSPDYAQVFLRELEKRRELMTLPELTKRETDVLELLAEGLTDRQIAAELGIRESTVSHHMKSVRAKFGRHAGTRTQLARMAFALGVADPPARRRRWPKRAGS